MLVAPRQRVFVRAGMGRAAPPSEEQLWSYLVQLTSALRAAHGAGLLLRPAALVPSKILLTSPGRIRVGACRARSPVARLPLAHSAFSGKGLLSRRPLTGLIESLVHCSCLTAKRRCPACSLWLSTCICAVP